MRRDKTSFQRFLGELRRRHVPQTAAVYLVAAWAAIEFADVVVPNLNGPQWVITAVIVAAGVGLPVVLVLAWLFDWGPDGLHRTDRPGPGEPGAVGADAGGPAPQEGTRAAPAPWMAAVAVLVVAIGSGIAVAALLERGGDEARDSPARPELPHGLVPHPGMAESESIRSRVMRDLEQIQRFGEPGRGGSVESPERFGGLDTMRLDDLLGLAVEAADEAGLTLFVQQPDEWKIGSTAPVRLREGDTLTVRGIARDGEGVTSVSLDGRVIARSTRPRPTLRFEGPLVGRAGATEATILVRTADGREIVREYPIEPVTDGSPR